KGLHCRNGLKRNIGSTMTAVLDLAYCFYLWLRIRSVLGIQIVADRLALRNKSERKRERKFLFQRISILLVKANSEILDSFVRLYWPPFEEEMPSEVNFINFYQ